MKLNQYISIFNIGLRQVVVSASNIVIPLVVIHFSSKETWGEFVSILLFILLANTLSNFGNKDFLLRSFSENPKDIKINFSKSLYNRLPVLLPFFIISFIIYPFHKAILTNLVIAGLFLSQSFEPVIIFEKKFRFSMVLETLLLTGFLVVLYLIKESITPTAVLAIYCGVSVLRSLFLSFYFKEDISFTKQSISVDFYKAIFPFFLLVFLGFLTSKIDVYLVNFFLKKTQLADYQIINSICLFAMGTATFLYLPFTKNIYRNSEEIILKLKKTLYFFGVIITVITVLLVFVIVKYYLKSDFPKCFYLIIFFYLLPSFFYGLEIISLFRNHSERKVINYLAIGVAINSISSALFLYLDYGIIGALLGSAIAQIIIFSLFYFESSKSKKLIS